MCRRKWFFSRFDWFADATLSIWIFVGLVHSLIFIFDLSAHERLSIFLSHQGDKIVRREQNICRWHSLSSSSEAKIRRTSNQSSIQQLTHWFASFSVFLSVECVSFLCILWFPMELNSHFYLVCRLMQLVNGWALVRNTYVSPVGKFIC